jgi:hypothetical protein
VCVCVCLYVCDQNDRLTCGDSVTETLLRSIGQYAAKGEQITPLTLQLALKIDVNPLTPELIPPSYAACRGFYLGF